jgi:steroid delta-isomerase-like uncharacterized protein
MSDPTVPVREYIDAVTTKNMNRIRELLHPEYSFTGGDGQRLEGPEAGVEVTQAFISAFPDERLEVQRMHVADKVVVAELTVSGTHRGELMGLAATGRRMELPVCNVMEVRDGKIYAERAYMDMAHLMKQLGV